LEAQPRLVVVALVALHLTRMALVVALEAVVATLALVKAQEVLRHPLDRVMLVGTETGTGYLVILSEVAVVAQRVLVQMQQEPLEEMAALERHHQSRVLA
jgi:hypothetical protein